MKKQVTVFEVFFVFFSLGALGESGLLSPDDVSALISSFFFLNFLIVVDNKLIIGNNYQFVDHYKVLRSLKVNDRDA